MSTSSQIKSVARCISGLLQNLERRLFEHRDGLTPGFASKYGCTRLVWYDAYDTIQAAIQREKTMKRWLRQ